MKRSIVALTFVIVFASYAIGFLDEVQITALGREDGPVENLGAIFFLLASGLFLAAYAGSASSPKRHGHIRRNVFLLLLGLLFLISAGEEISWGQRLFDWQTPPILADLNSQGETNLHNLQLFQVDAPYGSREPFWAMLLNMNRMFALFSLCFCVLVPLIDRFSSTGRQFFRRIRMPIAPLWIGVLFLSHAAFFHVLYTRLGLPFDVAHTLNELKESNYAFMFAVLGLHELRKQSPEGE